MAHFSPISVAVVGCGYWGPNLIRNVVENPDTTLVTVCDLDAAKREKILRRYPAVTGTDDFNTILNNPVIEAVVIATPVHTHYPLAKAALQAGKHVLVEKPMCMTVDECHELIALAEENQRILMVDHTFVYHGAVQRIKQEIDAGNLGNLLYFDSTRVNLGLFQSDVNVIWDLATHDLAMMDYLIGQNPVSVHASGACAAGRNQEAVAYLTVKFENDLIAHFNVSWLSPVKLRQILVGGDKKMILYNDLEPMEKIRIYDKGITVDEASSDEAKYQTLVGYRTGDMMAPNLDQTEALKTEIAHFVDCIRTGKRPITDGHAGLRVVQVLEAANLSLETGATQTLQPMACSV